MAVAAVIHKGRLKRGFDPRHLGQIDVSGQLTFVYGFKIKLFDLVSIDHNHAGFLGVGGINKHFSRHVVPLRLPDSPDPDRGPAGKTGWERRLVRAMTRPFAWAHDQSGRCPVDRPRSGGMRSRGSSRYFTMGDPSAARFAKPDPVADRKRQFQQPFTGRSGHPKRQTAMPCSGQRILRSRETAPVTTLAAKARSAQ